MADDPLAPFRRKPEPGTQAPEQAQVSDEHRALRAAIDALNEIPNTPLKGAYKNTYALIPVLETVWEKAEKEVKQPAANISMTDAEIEAVATHDLELLEAARQERTQEPEKGLKSEPVYTRMTDAEVEKAAHAIQLLEEAARAHKEQDIEPEL
jgi:hypothetical protein